MRHRKAYRRLSRFGSSRKALLRNIAVSLLREEKIITTLPRAKELRRLIDKLINLGKKRDLSSRRNAFKLLQDRGATELLFKDIALRFKESNSGYIRIIRYKNRKGDNAEMVIVELTIRKPKEKKATAAQKKKGASKIQAKEKKSAKEEKTAESKASREEKTVSLAGAESLEQKGISKEQGEEVKPKTKNGKVASKEERKQKGFLKGIRSLFGRRRKDQKEK